MRLLKAGKMPSLEDVRVAILEARRSYVAKIRGARQEAREMALVLQTSASFSLRI